MYHIRPGLQESFRYTGVSHKKNEFVIGHRPEKTSLSCQNRKELYKGHSFVPSGRIFLRQYVVQAAILLPKIHELFVTVIFQRVLGFSINTANRAIVIDQMVISA